MLWYYNIKPMKTTIDVPDELHDRIKKYNKLHQNSPINVSGTCRIALEKELDSKDAGI